MNAAFEKTWSAKECPLLAAWLTANEKRLELAVEASRRPKFFDPLVVSPKSLLLGALLPLAQFERDLANALLARAMLRLHDGKTDAAWQDLLAVHRLARLGGHGPTLVQALVADSIDRMACRVDQTLLQSMRLTATEALRMRDDLAKLSPLPSVAEKIDRGERFMYLDAVTAIARNGALLTDIRNLSGGGAKKSFMDSVLDSMLSEFIDWNVPLRIGNSWYDRIVQAFHKPSLIEQTKEFKKLEGELRLLGQRSKNWTLNLLTNTRQEASKRLGGVFVSLLVPAITSAAIPEHSAAMQFELTQLAFSLAAFRADHGSYPERLDELAPKYAATIPSDRFTDGKLHYHRDGDGYLLYSVGPNGKDDGGRLAEDDKDAKGWDDIIVRVPKSK